ncbi:putative uncharacterized protein [Aliivibrio wodanis]|uniref:Uncharacterized protein n=1 Tax=Aliivibrio wodanis TaxID=80852 RepID=A0A090I8V9_9GAMM|nr:putative uncharacterized protein [Aliivibrio wodanis]VVV06757.1 hypothetical protein AW0309160_04251 [Aliivibrio wodanis]
MKRFLQILTLCMISYQSYAALELMHTYQDWQHYQSQDIETGEPIILGVSDVSSDHSVNTVVLRCTTEGVNLLFLKSLSYEERGYSAKASVDSGSTFGMDVWVKGRTHWATIPLKKSEAFINGNSLSVTLLGDANSTEKITLSLKGFRTMYETILPSCR